jgi:hypothetical protein
MCGVGGKADRRPIDPPPIVQLRVIDPDRTNARARGRQRSPGGRRSTDSDEDEDEVMDERGQERLVFFSPSFLLDVSYSKTLGFQQKT